MREMKLERPDCKPTSAIQTQSLKCSEHECGIGLVRGPLPDKRVGRDIDRFHLAVTRYGNWQFSLEVEQSKLSACGECRLGCGRFRLHVQFKDRGERPLDRSILAHRFISLERDTAAGMLTGKRAAAKLQAEPAVAAYLERD